MDAVIELLDAGETHGRATFHYQAAINGEEWKRGDVFYVRDRHGVPRPVVFEYVTDGRVTCYSRQRFRSADGFVPCGFTSKFMPVRSAMNVSEAELEVQQLAADLIDIGEDVEAERLLDTFATTGDVDELEQAKRRAQRVIDEHEDE